VDEVPELFKLLKQLHDQPMGPRLYRMMATVRDHVEARERTAKGEVIQMVDGMLIKLLRRLGGYYDHLEPSDKAVTLERTYQYIQELERRARLDEHKVLAALDDEGKKQRYFELSNE